MKIYLALFISFVYAAESQDAMKGTIEKVSKSGFDQLDSDTFYYIMAFLDAEEVLSFKILSRGIYHKVRRLWPRMELYTNIKGPWSADVLVDFSHKCDIYGLSVLKDQIFPYNRAQLSCLREFSLLCSKIHNLQVVINLLPRDSLTSLRIQNFELCLLTDKLQTPTFKCPLISNINFPKLTRLELGQNISLSYSAFSSLPDCMRVIKLLHIFMDAATSSSLAMALGTMNGLDTLSLFGCKFSEGDFSAILENLPTSLKRLDINYISLFKFDKKLFEIGLKRLKGMKSLQEISFIGINDEFAHEIILNLPECIANIDFDMDRETLCTFKQRSGEFINVKSINICCLQCLDHPVKIECISLIQQVFPNLNRDIKEGLDIYKDS